MSPLHTSEKGQTMMETIAIFGLISLIAYGVSYAWGHLMAAAQADEINKRIIAMATQRRLNMPKIQNQAYKHTEEGPYGVQLSIENGINGTHAQEFWVTVDEIKSEALGNEVANYHSDTIPASNIEKKQNEQGDQEVKIYFDKFDTHFNNGAK